MTLTAWAIDEVSNDAKICRLAFGSLIAAAGGTLAAGGLEVKQKLTPDMHVIVNGGTPEEGAVWVPGFTVSTGPYYVYNSADFELAIPASDETNPRVETIVARVKDKAVEGTGHEPLIEALKGTAEPGATLENLKGIAAVPKGCYVLGYVLVPAKATSIVTADIKNVAAQMGLRITGNKWTALTSVATGTSYEHEYSATNDTEVIIVLSCNAGPIHASVLIGGVVVVKECELLLKGEILKQLQIKVTVPAGQKLKVERTGGAANFVLETATLQR